MVNIAKNMSLLLVKREGYNIRLCMAGYMLPKNKNQHRRIA